MGPNQAAPFRVITPGAASYPAKVVEACFACCDAGDYGSGEAGSAVYEYEVCEQEAPWLIDNAVRAHARASHRRATRRPRQVH
jgi:hypothetical protein